MLRRDIFTAMVTGAAGILGVSAAHAAPQPPARLKVAYHLSDADKVGFVLGNIRNHVEGTGGNVDIALVVHGPALAAFKASGASATIASRFAGLVKGGLSAHACGNTLKGMNMQPADLVPGFAIVEAGGVVKLAEMQSQGYVYLRP